MPRRKADDGTKEWLTSAEAGALIAASTATIRRYHRDGHLPARRTPGGQRRFRRADVLALLELDDTSNDGLAAS